MPVEIDVFGNVITKEEVKVEEPKKPLREVVTHKTEKPVLTEVVTPAEEVIAEEEQPKKRGRKKKVEE